MFARNLRKARSARRLSQEALAHEAGVDRTYVSALERGVYNATIVMVAKLAKALGVEPSVFAEPEGKFRNWPRLRRFISRARGARSDSSGLTGREGRTIEAQQRLKLKMKSQKNAAAKTTSRLSGVA